MDTVSLTVESRDVSRKPKQLRVASIVPCVLYGNDTENVSLQVDHNELFKVYKKAGESTVIELTTGDNKPLPVLFHAIDFDPVSELIIHVDFYVVDMKKEIEAHVPLDFVGESPAVKNLGGSLLTILDTVNVRCLPANLPHTIEVDISGLEEFGDSILISDLKLPDNVTVTQEPDQQVANAQAPRKIEEELPLEQPEDEEGAEGEGEEGAEDEGEEGGESENND